LHNIETPYYSHGRVQCYRLQALFQGRAVLPKAFLVFPFSSMQINLIVLPMNPKLFFAHYSNLLCTNYPAIRCFID
jgi:hypothetical protein